MHHTSTQTKATIPTAMHSIKAASAFDLDLPSMPQVMVELSLAMAQDQPSVRDISNIVSRDMALSASIMRTLNSPVYALRKPVDSIDMAIDYLGFREVAAQTFQHALRSVFAPSKQLDLIMGRATLRSLVMGRLAQLLEFTNPWHGHAAGIFQECGKAILLRSQGNSYADLLEKHGSDEQSLREAEIVAFGMGNDELSALLCEKWGVAQVSCDAVRLHIDVATSRVLPSEPQTAEIAFLAIVANTMLNNPSAAVELATSLSDQIGKDARLVAGMTEKVLTLIASPT